MINNRKNISLWMLYDFANSIAIVVFFLYFSQWLVVDRGVSDFWFNMIFVASTILLLFTAPIVGVVADKVGVRLPGLRKTTTLMFVFLLLTSLVALFAPKLVVLVWIFYMLGNFFYQLSFCYYNPLLHDIAPPEKQGLVSGLGQSANWIGQIAGLLITLPLAGGAIYLFGAHGRAQTFLPATLIFIVLSLPMLLWFREGVLRKNVVIKVLNEYRNFWGTFKNLIRAPGVGIFLLGFFFFNDAVLTASQNFAIYLENVFHVPDATKSLLLVSVLVTSAIGAFISGLIADRFGLKRTLLFILFGWLIIFPVLGSLHSFKLFVVATTVMGFLWGGVWAVSRALLSSLAPEGDINHAFSYYTLAERFSSFVGPVTWGLITSGLVSLGADRYRIAMYSLTAFILFGIFAVRMVPERKVSTSIL